MLLIVGLGNPSFEYQETRHNFGSMVVDNLFKKFGSKKNKMTSDTHLPADYFKFSKGGQDFIAAKPLTFMNDSGLAVKNMLKRFNLSNNELIVIHDDLDLDLGQMRIKKNSSSGGHLGIESIVHHIGTKNFIRLRLGIGRPHSRKDAAQFVLQEFKKSECEEVEFTISQATDAIIYFAKFALEKTMSKYN